MRTAIIAPVKNFFSPAETLIKKEREVLLNLKKELQKLETMPNKIEAIVKLFQIVSPMNDSNNFNDLLKSLEKRNYGQLTKKIVAFKSLLSHLNKTDRDSFGMNRTLRGQAVANENIFLGNVYGVWMKPASYWLEESKRPSEALKIIHNQAKNFVESHAPKMIMNINIILEK